MTETNPIVGHKTLAAPGGGYRHEPRRQNEADALMADIEAAKAKRAEDMPDEAAALSQMLDAHQRLKELGWSEAIYCPKDGTIFDAIEAGSSGIHKCHYSGQWPDGSWWIHSHGDLWPSRPILFRLTPNACSRGE